MKIFKKKQAWVMRGSKKENIRNCYGKWGFSHPQLLQRFSSHTGNSSCLFYPCLWSYWLGCYQYARSKTTTIVATRRHNKGPYLHIFMLTTITYPLVAAFIIMYTARFKLFWEWLFVQAKGLYVVANFILFPFLHYCAQLGSVFCARWGSRFDCSCMCPEEEDDDSNASVLV